MNRPSFTFKFFYKLNYYSGRAVVKIEVHDGFHWLEEDELNTAIKTGRPTPIAAMADVTFKLCVAHGLDQSCKERFFGRKTVWVDGPTFPLEELAACGWDIEPYPDKYLRPYLVDHAAVFEDARSHGVHIDVANLVFDKSTIGTRGFALKGLVDLMRHNEIPVHLYADYSMFGRLRATEMTEVYSYLNGLLRDHGPDRMITESPFGKSVDPIMLDWANRTHGHVISKDAFDDFDMAYDWIPHGAENGTPRIHKFLCDGISVGVPDLGLSIEIPGSF